MFIYIAYFLHNGKSKCYYIKAVIANQNEKYFNLFKMY